MKHVLGERGVMAKTMDEVSGGTMGHNEALARLQGIPNVGPRMASALLKLGIARLQDAAGRNPDEIYHEDTSAVTARASSAAATPGCTGCATTS
jgi:predicted flap endonuclease-1-like 5' DNA nuclease